jgi:hypothetical protein
MMMFSLSPGYSLFVGISLASRFADAAGFAMFPQGSMTNRGLSSSCEATLYQTVRCPEEAANLVAPGNTIADDAALLESVCHKTCGGSIGHQSSKVALACGTEEFFSGITYVSLIDQLWSSWNKTCVTDPKTGKNCNGK